MQHPIKIFTPFSGKEGKTSIKPGERFHQLTVLYRGENSPSGKARWVCQCDCGNYCLVTTQKLKNGSTKSCGCYKLNVFNTHNTAVKEAYNLIGKKFGRLTVLRLITTASTKSQIWECECFCGNKSYPSTHDLISGHTTSCGCIRVEKVRQMGENNNLNYTGIRSGLLTVIEPTTMRSPDGKIIWKCRCDCGNIIYCPGSQVKMQQILSCGCISRSYGELKIAEILKENHYYFKQDRKCFDDLIMPGGKPARFDFIIYNNSNEIIRIIEYDGEQHYKEWTLGDETLQERQFRDNLKNKYVLSKNIPLVRIPYWEKNNLSIELIMSDKYLITTDMIKTQNEEETIQD